jgi:acetyl esterase/lipase
MTLFFRFCARALQRLSIPAVACLSLAACSATDVVNSLTPDDGYRVETGLAYGPGERYLFDLYRPDQPRKDAPLIVFFYGGGWDSGSREDYLFIGQAFAAKGCTVAIPDYRLYPEVGWRGFMEDSARAVAHLAENHSDVQSSDRGLVLAGHSAGAYIATLLALDGDWLARAGTDVCRIESVIGLAGPYDFLPLRSKKLRDIFGPGEAGPETQPVAHADAGGPPMLLASGSNDVVVLPRNTRALSDRLWGVGVSVTERIYEDVSHTQIVGAMSVPFRSLAPTHDDVFAFLAGNPAQARANCD